MDLTINVFSPLANTIPPWTSTSPLSIDAGGIDIGGDSNGSSSNMHAATITDNSTVTVTVTQDGFYPYTMDVNVWTDDLTFNVVLIGIITDTENPFFNMGFPGFNIIQRPCGGVIDIYRSASNGIGESEFYVNGSLAHKGDRFIYESCTAGQVQFIHRMTTYDVTAGSCPTKEIRWDLYYNVGEPIYGNSIPGEVDSVQSYLDQSTTSNFTIDPFGIEVVLETSPSKDECNCYNQNTLVEITPTVTFKGDPSGNETITWVISDPDGLEILNETVNNVVDPAFVTLEDLGIYKVVAIVNNDCEDVSYTLEINTCDFIVINQTDCSDFVIQNKGSEDVTFEIQDIQGTVILPSETLASLTERTITFDQVGFYNVIVTTNTETRNYLINNYCEIENCISSYIESLLCEPVDRCNPCPDESDLNQMLLFQYTYFNKLHKEFTFNNYYTGLDQSKIDQITSIEQLADKLLSFCQRLHCLNSDTFRPAGSENYDWAGKGSNCEKTCSCSPPQTLNYYQTGPSKKGCNCS